MKQQQQQQKIIYLETKIFYISCINSKSYQKLKKKVINFTFQDQIDSF